MWKLVQVLTQVLTQLVLWNACVPLSDGPRFLLTVTRSVALSRIHQSASTDQ